MSNRIKHPQILKHLTGLKLKNLILEDHLTLDLSNFVFDVIKVTHLFFSEIEQKAEAGAALPEIERANNIISVWGPLGVIVAPNFGMIDPILSCLDSTNITWAILENEIYKLCLEK